jgi:uncharacterized membrane protein YqgA involved in biofilm formation
VLTPKQVRARIDGLVLVCVALGGAFGLWACRSGGGPWQSHLRAFLIAAGLLLVAACLQSLRGGRWAPLHALAAILRLVGGLALLAGGWRILAADDPALPLISCAILVLVGEALRVGLQALELAQMTQRPTDGQASPARR